MTADFFFAKLNDPSLFNTELKGRGVQKPAQQMKCQRTSEETAVMAKGYLQVG